jgi:hypothetical protein
MLNHGENCLIPLVIVLMEQNSFLPHLVHLARSNESWDNQLVGVGVDVIHESIWRVLGIHNTQVSVDTVVCSLESHALLKKGDKLLVETEFLVVLDEVLEVIWVDDDVETTEIGSSELLSSDASEADCFPNLWDISSLSSLISLGEIKKHDMDLGKFLVVADLGVKDFGSVEKLVVEASVTDYKNISLLWLSNKCLDITEVLVSTLSVREDEFLIDHLLLL